MQYTIVYNTIYIQHTRTRYIYRYRQLLREETERERERERERQREREERSILTHFAPGVNLTTCVLLLFPPD